MATPARLHDALATLTGADFRGEIRAALPPGVPLARFVAVARTALIESPELAACDMRSLFSALKRCAADGLMPDGREAALVTHWSGRKQAQEAVYIPMITGLRKIAAEHGISITAYAVYAGDHFAYSLGLEPELHHVPAPLGDDPGVLVGAYAVARDQHDRRYVEVMSRRQIDALRSRSRASDKGPWASDYDEMARKTVARRLFKQVPLLLTRAPADEAEYDFDGVAAAFDEPAATPKPRALVAADAAFDEPIEPIQEAEWAAAQALDGVAAASTAPTAPPATEAQARKLNTLYGTLRKAERLTVEQLWQHLARERQLDVEAMVELLGGRDEAGQLHFGPLRNSLTKAEASDLIEHLVTLEATPATGMTQ